MQTIAHFRNLGLLVTGDSFPLVFEVHEDAQLEDYLAYTKALEAKYMVVLEGKPIVPNQFRGLCCHIVQDNRRIIHLSRAKGLEESLCVATQGHEEGHAFFDYFGIPEEDRPRHITTLGVYHGLPLGKWPGLHRPELRAQAAGMIALKRKLDGENIQVELKRERLINAAYDILPTVAGFRDNVFSNYDFSEISFSNGPVTGEDLIVTLSPL